MLTVQTSETNSALISRLFTTQQLNYMLKKKQMIIWQDIIYKDNIKNIFHINIYVKGTTDVAFQLKKYLLNHLL